MSPNRIYLLTPSTEYPILATIVALFAEVLYILTSQLLTI